MKREIILTILWDDKEHLSLKDTIEFLTADGYEVME